jgi:hypothetical protein
VCPAEPPTWQINPEAQHHELPTPIPPDGTTARVNSPDVQKNVM